MTGLPNPRDVDPYLINDFYNVYLVNETIPYFQPKYTKTIFEKLNKKMPNWDFDSLETKLSDSQFTDINIHVCVHGLGEVSKDIEFHALRHNMFKGDSFACLKAGVKRIHKHDFRHSHASNLIANGVNIVAVSKCLGHSDISMTLSFYTLKRMMTN